MSYLREQDDDDVLAGKDHELTLSTAAIFGIFFGLVLLCAVFFGFGYSLGSHKSPPPLPAEASAATAGGTDFSTFKPAAGQPVGSSNNPKPISTASAVTTTVLVDPPPVAKTTTVPAAQPAAPIVRTAPAAHPIAVPSAPPAEQVLFVQVAAINISHSDDATRMINALRAKGYAASAHPAQDNFIHILIGPFAARPAAEGMVQRLRDDGYVAYIK